MCCPEQSLVQWGLELFTYLCTEYNPTLSPFPLVIIVQYSLSVRHSSCGPINTIKNITLV